MRQPRLVVRWLAVIATAGALCAPASAMTPEAARTAAAAINLVPGDVPGFDSEPMPPGRGDEQVVPHCPRLDLVDRHALANQPSEAFFRRGASSAREVHSQVEVVPSVPAAERVMAVLRLPRTPSCLERMLRAAVIGELHVTRVTVRRVAVLALRGALGLRCRVGYVRSGRHWISVSDIRYFRRGPAIVSLETSALGQPAAPSLVDPLLRLLARRAVAALPSPGS